MAIGLACVSASTITKEFNQCLMNLKTPRFWTRLPP